MSYKEYNIANQKKKQKQKQQQLQQPQQQQSKQLVHKDHSHSLLQQQKQQLPFSPLFPSSSPSSTSFNTKRKDRASEHLLPVHQTDQQQQHSDDIDDEEFMYFGRNRASDMYRANQTKNNSVINNNNNNNNTSSSNNERHKISDSLMSSQVKTKKYPITFEQLQTTLSSNNSITGMPSSLSSSTTSSLNDSFNIRVNSPKLTIFEKDTPQSQLAASLASSSSTTTTTPTVSTVAASIRKPILLSEEIVYLFWNRSIHNTIKGIETGALLCGRDEKTHFVITELIFPNQVGRDDSFECINDEQVFCYQLERSLLTLGWIHTHPTQTVFLSSVDIHNHYCYQQQLKESIAVVVSPKPTPNYEVFSLSAGGMDSIAKCSLKGFHPHDDADSLYQSSPHVRVVNSSQSMIGSGSGSGSSTGLANNNNSSSEPLVITIKDFRTSSLMQTYSDITSIQFSRTSTF
ncbi:hypothetical protein SAMD00019534_084690 [Acytostelium subglobosum LB1]|uniref:hypothetical protein n=1 Tax=Acytostelium subglobosum LB1 TaxID=1410327 RepID=UPI000644C1CC|nr:hypothetical protein SAMD00019534_084690 [Acytostelium subglobosum LB1]GAM25294.1 hypothetical protein SAMD00019534_084690 [Acytostelium subglobosum LB1]|eukprot:XP_012751814.1 hypothetical protein SAMD00019534_084690 [Acytostelium subglobosum LB1]